jgi:hypothetical protein
VQVSGAAILDQVKAGESLQAIADGLSAEHIVVAVLAGKSAIRYGLAALDDAALARRDIGGWTIPDTIGHALRADADAHRIARSLAIGRTPDIGIVYDEAGPPTTKAGLLAAIAEAEARAAEARILAAGGPKHAHRDVGELDARGWILFIAVHDALHLHQAAAIARAPR